MGKGQGSRNSGSKFLPGGGKNNGQNGQKQSVHDQTSRTILTNPSHIGGRGGK
jgi:hypothetical protein